MIELTDSKPGTCNVHLHVHVLKLHVFSHFLFKGFYSKYKSHVTKDKLFIKLLHSKVQ